MHPRTAGHGGDNGGGEAPLVGGQIPHWKLVSGAWARATAGSGGYPPAQEGTTYLYPGTSSPLGELRQDVNVSPQAAEIDAGLVSFEFRGYVQTFSFVPPDTTQIVVEYRDALNAAILGQFDSGEIGAVSGWQLVSDTRVAPAGTRFVRVRLVGRLKSGSSNDAYFDGLSLRSNPLARATLFGSASDDALPLDGSLTSAWTASGPGPVGLADPTSLVTAATFTVTGTYVLHLAVTDGQLTTGRDVTVTVSQENREPVVSAGPNRQITLPTTTATLNGSVSDDALPNPPGALTVTWTQRSGPSTVSFGSPSQPVTTVTASTAGAYVLRLTVGDSELTSFSEVTLTVDPPGRTNQPPVVSAGSSQSFTLPATATLNGSITDDGLPEGVVPTVAWSVVSGPGTVTFGTPGQPVTTASVSVAGTYVLRLTGTDTQYTVSSDTTLTVSPAGNRAPIVSAGADQTITVPATTVALSGSFTDDGLPAGAAVSVAWSVASGPGSVVFASPRSPTTTAVFDAAGVYVLRLTANDTALTGSDDVTVFVNALPPSGGPPAAHITSPADGSRITGRVTVSGTVSSASLLGWKLEYRRTDDSAWTRFASGATPVNGALGVLDPTLLINGAYEVRLTARDLANRSAVTSIGVVVKDGQKVGNFTVSFVDLEVPVAGIPIRIARSYDSRDKGRGDFGVGWRLDVSSVRVGKTVVPGLDWFGSTTGGLFPSYCVSPVRPHIVTVTFPGGRVEQFQQSLTPSCQLLFPMDFTRAVYQPMPGSLGTLEPVDGSDVLVLAGWPGEAQLASALDFSLFDPRQFRYTAPDGRTYIVDQVQGLTRMSDLNGNVLTVTPGGISHSSGKNVTFLRDSDGRITSITDPLGRAMTYTYDFNGDLASYTDRENQRSTFGYNETHGLASIQDPRGIQPIRNEYDSAGRLFRHTDAFGKTITYTHDLDLRQEVVTDRNGATRVLEYDARGNVVRETDPAGAVTLRTFDARDNRLSEMNALGQTTSFAYDTQDNLLSVTDPLANRTEYTYNARRQVLTTKDARGRFSVNDYDVKGNLLSTKSGGTSVTGPFLTETSYTYDTSGNVKTQSTTVDGVVQITRYDYDSFGNLTKETDPLGHETTYVNDANGNRTTQTTTRTIPTGTETLITTYVYDKQNRLTRTTDPDGSFTRTFYDALGHASSTIDKLNQTTTYVYDDMGRLIRTTYPDNTTDQSTYDAEGRRLTSTDRAGRVTRYAYDALGRLTRTTFADGSVTTNSYDAAGRLAATQDARGQLTRFVYDAAGRRTKVIDPLGHEMVFTHDGNGNQTSVKDPNGFTTSFEYDELNRRTRTIFPDTTFTATTYDTLGRRRAETDQAGKTTGFEYDARGRLTKVTDALSHETRYAYDQVGNRISQTDANNHITRFEYDKLGRETKRILPDGKFETKTYDLAGNLKTRPDFLGRTTTYGYDTNNRLLSRTYPIAAQNVSFTYTQTGRRATMVDARGTTNYAYDIRDRLSRLTTPQGWGITHTYDRNGNRTSLQGAVGAAFIPSTTYAYDAANRLESASTHSLTGNQDYAFGYDNNGNRKSLTYPNQVRTDYTYDTLNRLRNLSTARSGSVLQSYDLELGQAGNRRRITDADGTIRDYSYDDIYRLTGETVSGLLSYGKTFGYNDVGNRLTQVTTGSGAPGTPTAPGTVNYTYDDRDRLLTENGSALTYDDNGNLTGKAADGSVLTWDLENRLTKVTKPGGTVVEYLYDADGTRVQTKTTLSGGPTTTVNYLVDTSGSLSHVLAEIDGSSNLTTYYVRADGELLSILRPAGPTTYTAKYVHSDHIGSIRRLTDESGAVTDTYVYTAFGELVSHTGTDPQPYAFAGEPYDPNVGFQYHRARWMDPRAGRFLGMDPFGGSSFDPPTLHKYLYAGAEPVGRVDPTGLDWNLPSITQVMGAILVLAAVHLPKLTTALYTVADTFSPIELGLRPGAIGISQLRTAVKQGGSGVLRQLASIWRRWRVTGGTGGATGTGKEFEKWIGNFLPPSARSQVGLSDGLETGKKAGKAVVDYAVDEWDTLLEVKNSFSTVSYQQALQVGWHASETGKTVHYVFLKRPTAQELKDLAEWLADGANEARNKLGQVLISFVEP